MKINLASGIESRTCQAPWMSISRMTDLPTARAASTGLRGVPYRFLPCTVANSSISPAAMAASNCS